MFTVFTLISLLSLKSIAEEVVWRQTLYFGIGFLLFYFFAHISFKDLKRFVFIFYYLLNIVLLYLLIRNQQTRGITAWIDLFGGFKFQPSQLAIPIVSIFLLSVIRRPIKSFKQYCLYLGIIALPGILIMIEPDFGTAFIYFIALGLAFLFIKIPKHYLIFTFISLLIFIILGWSFILKPYQKARLASFFRHSEVNETSDYNATQALIAVGSGRITGRGLGFGVQSHLRFLPESQTDFIFASIAEEWGFIGAMLIILLYFSLLTFLYRLIFLSHNFEVRNYCLVIFTMTFLQTFINIGMNIGLVPITGITLPLLSYGGSSIISFFMMYGVVQSYLLHARKDVNLYLS